MKNIILKVHRALKYFLVDIKIKFAAQRSSRKVVIGASGVSQPGWIETNINHLNILNEKDWARYFHENSIAVILSEHVLEHLTVEEGKLAARNCLRYLKRGGYFRIAVPDGYFPDSRYIEQVQPMGCGPGADDHKTLYNYQTLSDVFRSCGFTVDLLEYWDENGQFHYTPWNSEKGLIHRSRWNDHRNNETEIHYTSIILDAIKP